MINKPNVYNNKDDRKNYLEKYFTDAGVNALEARLKALVKLYIQEPKYPMKARMFGFVLLEIQSKEHHEGMMENLRQILGLKEIALEVN